MESDLHQIIVSPQELSEDHIKVFTYQILRGAPPPPLYAMPCHVGDHVMQGSSTSTLLVSSTVTSSPATSSSTATVCSRSATLGSRARWSPTRPHP